MLAMMGGLVVMRQVDVLKRLPDGREVSVSSRDYYNHQ